MGIKLTDKGDRIVRRGGADDQSADDMLLLEIMKRAPGMSPEEYQHVFITCLEQYGEDALEAVRSGHVKFELCSTRDMAEPKPEDGGQ